MEHKTIFWIKERSHNQNLYKIPKYQNSNITINELAKMIKLSYKQTKRLWTIYQQDQDLLLIHKNKNKLSYQINDCSIFIEKYIPLKENLVFKILI